MFIFFFQIPEIERRLKELIEKVENELEPEARNLYNQIEAIQAPFFQLECDRIKERFAIFTCFFMNVFLIYIFILWLMTYLCSRFRMLLTRLSRIHDLMTTRERLVTEVGEFKKHLQNREARNILLDNGDLSPEARRFCVFSFQ